MSTAAREWTDQELFNIAGPELRPDPYPAFRELLRRGPVLENPLYGVWMVLGYEEVDAALNAPDAFSSVFEGDPITAFLRNQAMLSTDPPDHERLRRVVATAFTPRSIQALEGRIVEIADELVRAMADAGEADAVAGLAAPLPVIIIAELLGIPPSDRLDFKRWSQAVVAITQVVEADPALREEAQRSAEALLGYLGAVIVERRRAPKNDLVTRMVEANADGSLSDAELIASCVLLLLAGNETTTNLIANAVLALGRHPAERRRLVEDPSLLKNAIEELLRFDPPAQSTIRRTTRDVALGGRTVPAESRVLLLVAAANRDPRVFADPDRLDVARENARLHLGFGSGIHFCIGAALARLEGRIALQSLLKIAPDYTLGSGAGTEYGASFILRGLSRLPIAIAR